MPSIKVTYFNIKARAEPIRLALTIGGIAFEDERIGKEQFVSLKEQNAWPFRQLPILTVDGKIIAQSTAILRYVGKLSGLYPSDPYQAALVDMIISQVQDLEGAMKPSGAEQDQEKKLKMRSELASNVFPSMLQDLDRVIQQHGGKYAVGDSISIADLFLYQANTSYSSGAYDGIPPTLFQPYVHIQKVVAAVKTHPKVAAWEASH
jgi:glutathione S-transferase